ncbi:MAG: alpha/beta fold hydrolase [Candidatus Rokubacteria bacterium]|nr:alpha/beta fold hydrolase [Candidatus Rokubacteria bacterium]
MGREFVFVHGMSHGAWCWRTLCDRLDRRGHRTLAVDLPGHGARAHEWRRASVGTYAAAVADAMAQAGFSAAVVVGHSMAGVVLPKVAERASARVAHLVFLAAVVVPSGASLLETHLAPPARALLRGLARSGGGRVQYPAVLEHARWMGQLAPGDPRVVDALIRLTPQPLRPWTERVDCRRFSALRVPRTYVRCLRDAAVVPAKAAEYAARLGVTPVDLDTDHGPMLSDPEALARILEAL